MSLTNKQICNRCFIPSEDGDPKRHQCLLCGSTISCDTKAGYHNLKSHLTTKHGGGVWESHIEKIQAATSGALRQAPHLS